MSQRIRNEVVSRLSLRQPQQDSLDQLIEALTAAPEMLSKERDVDDILNKLKNEFSKLQDFERDFPSLCFALATGVGKTRLMGAFIAYLHLVHQINNFFVLAPNLTIYNKLITDFTPNTPKYVFKGIACFAQNSPLIITGDNYEQQSAVVSGLLDTVRINIFNIAKINSEVRGGKEPRIKRLREVLGESYFEHLANLPDLVLLMDESHRYRASAGVRSINELNPLIGLELTATPFVESSKGPLPFRNVVIDYPLARAMEDGFVKEPAVVTQRGFNAKDHSPDEIEKIKLEDGVRLHEITKVELTTYARENGEKQVKPFMLVIARDTTHAASLLKLIESDEFYEGRYRGKVIQVDSSRTGAEEEAMITRLLAVENIDEPTEIVIHVNMLKEGWDVTNLYTIVPLRAANARTLVEQSIGRGLRLPYGKRTGVDSVDRLNIVAHDKFQEIIDEANRPDSPIRLKQIILGAPSAADKQISVQIKSRLHSRLGLVEPEATTGFAVGSPAQPVFQTEQEKAVAGAVLEVLGQYEKQRDKVPSTKSLLKADVKKEIAAHVAERIKPQQANLLEGADATVPVVDVDAVVAKTLELIVDQSINIPRIIVEPIGTVNTGFHPFTLDTSSLNLQPRPQELLSQYLTSGRQVVFAVEAGLKEKRPEDYIVHALIDFDDIDYNAHAELLYDLAGQAVNHLRSYLDEESEVISVLDGDRKTIAKEIHAQMMEHFWEKATAYQVHVTQGFSKELKPCNHSVSANQKVHSYRETVTDKSAIKKMLFGDFTKCLYPIQKFDSDTERRFAVILERDAQKWFKPVRGQFLIYYKQGNEQPEYIPDFVAETDQMILMVETKARDDLKASEVQEKARAGAQWCKHASDYALSVGEKPWKYLLVPHDEVNEAQKLEDFLRFEVKAGRSTRSKMDKYRCAPCSCRVGTAC